MTIIAIQLRVPAIACDFCEYIAHPHGVNAAQCAGIETLPPTLGIHRISNNPEYPEFAITGFTQADLDAQATEAGWKKLKVYAKELTICPECQKPGAEPGFDDRLKRLALLLGMKAILAAPSFEAAKEIAQQAIREGESGLAALSNSSTSLVEDQPTQKGDSPR
jgi:hypothetical protein